MSTMNPKLTALASMGTTKSTETGPEGADENKVFEDAISELKELGLPDSLEKKLREWYQVEESDEETESSGPSGKSMEYDQNY